MYHCQVNDQTELRLIEPRHAGELFHLLESNREHMRLWLPWVNVMRTSANVEKAIAGWQHIYSSNLGVCAGIWHEGRLCGMIHHLNVDWVNRSTTISYWLDAGHQGRGIMTECCRAFVAHGFNAWKLNRITIECATDNVRSRAIPERLGFKLEGVARSVEWLHDHFVDHAIYGLLRSDFLSYQAILAAQPFLPFAGLSPR
jgi:ribosomal-protein-serine acetyltransferase